MLVVEKKEVINSFNMEDYTTYGIEELTCSLYEEFSKLETLSTDLQLKNHALLAVGELYERVSEDDDENIKLYAASEAMEYARLAKVDKDITYGNEGLFNFIFKVISSIFKAIIGLIKLIINVIKKIISLLFGLGESKSSGSDSSSFKANKKEVIEKTFNKAEKDIVDALEKYKEPTTPLSDDFIKNQKAKVERLKRKLLHKANSFKYLKLYNNVIKNGSIDTDSIIDAYKYYVDGIQQLSIFMNKVYIKILVDNLIEFRYEKAERDEATNIADIAEKYVEFIEKYDKAAKLLEKNNVKDKKDLPREDRREFDQLNNKAIDIVNSQDSPVRTSFRTLVIEMTRKALDLTENEYKAVRENADNIIVAFNNRGGIPVSEGRLPVAGAVMEAGTDVWLSNLINNKYVYAIREALDIDKRYNRAILGVSSKRIFLVETLEVDKAKLKEIDKKIVISINEINEGVENDTLPFDQCLLKTAKVLHSISSNLLLKLTSKSIDELSELDNIEIKDISTKNLDGGKFELVPLKKKIGEIKKEYLEYFGKLESSSKNVKKLKDDLKDKTRTLERHEKRLRKLEDKVKDELKHLDKMKKDTAGTIIKEIMSTVSDTINVYGNNIKELGKVSIVSTTAYKESRFLELINGILNLYKEQMILDTIDNYGI